MDSHALSPFGSDLPGHGMSNMSVLIEDLIQFVSGTMTTFSQGDGTKIKSKQFLEFGSRNNTVSH